MYTKGQIYQIIYNDGNQLNKWNGTYLGLNQYKNATFLIENKCTCNFYREESDNMNKFPMVLDDPVYDVKHKCYCQFLIIGKEDWFVI